MDALEKLIHQLGTHGQSVRYTPLYSWGPWDFSQGRDTTVRDLMIYVGLDIQ
jgi:hypothetical protein